MAPSAISPPPAYEQPVLGKPPFDQQLRTVFPPLVLEDHPIDERPPFRVIVAGGGISGITAGILFPAKVPGIDLVIYERNDNIVRPRILSSCIYLHHPGRRLAFQCLSRSSM
jgi:hypothetical protein